MSQKKIGVITATIVGMNAMIGAGIFSVPAAFGSAVGPAGLITYAFVIFAVWCMGSAMAHLAHYYPQEGSFYIYARQWGGHKIGLLAAGLYVLGLVIAMSHLTHTIGLYLHHYFPLLSPWHLGFLSLIFLAILNVVGVHLSQAGQMVLICTTIFPLIAIIVLCISHGSLVNFIPFVPFGWRSVFSATRIVIFGFFGFESASSLFHIVEQPQKNVPRALVAAIILVGLLYMMFVGSLIFAVPLYYFLDPSIPLSETLGLLFPEHPWLFELIHFSIFSAVFGTVHSMVWAASSLLTAFFRQVHKHKNILKPHSVFINDKISVLIIVTAILIGYLTLDDPDLFFSLTAVCIILAFMLAMIALFFKDAQSLWKKTQEWLGFLTAGVILYFSLEGVVTVLYKKMSSHEASHVAING